MSEIYYNGSDSISGSLRSSTKAKHAITYRLTVAFPLLMSSLIEGSGPLIERYRAKRRGPPAAQPKPTGSTFEGALRHNESYMSSMSPLLSEA